MRASSNSNHKYHYLYKLVLKKNNKIYYGIHSTNNLQDRYFAFGTYIASNREKSDWVKSNHGKNMKNSRLYNAMQKYGPEGFEREIIEMFRSRVDALKREEEIVTEEFINSGKSLNNRVGGMQGQFSRAVREKISKNNPMHRDEIRKKVSKKQKERWTKSLREDFSKNNPMHNPKIREQHSGKNSSWFGREHTKKSKLKISVANTGKKQSSETIAKKTESQKNTLRKATEILDKKTNRKFNSLSHLRNYLRQEENLKKGLSSLSEIARGLRPHDKLHDRIIYTKKRYNGKPEARIFLRGKIWQVRIWVPKDKRYFKKSLGTQNSREAKKLAKLEEKTFYGET